MKNFVKENWRSILLVPIIPIVGIIIFCFAKIIDRSPSLQFIFEILGIAFLTDIIWKILSEERQKKKQTKELKEIEKKYFDK